MENQTPLIGAYLLLITEKGILLSQRGNGQWTGAYSLVAGHTEKGETVIDAIIREAKEEADITLDESDLTVVSAVHRPQADYKGQKTDIIDFFIKAEKYTGTICNMEPEKCKGLSFFALDSLPENVLPQVKEAINLLKTNTFYSQIR